MFIWRTEYKSNFAREHILALYTLCAEFGISSGSLGARHGLSASQIVTFKGGVIYCVGVVNFDSCV